MSSTRRFFHFLMGLRRYIHRPWYLPMVAFLAGLDLFILIVPTDGLLITSVLAKPKQWIQAFLWVSIGSTLGAWSLACLIEWNPDWMMAHLFPGFFRSTEWQWMSDRLNQFGFWFLSFLAVSPFPTQPGVVLASLAKISPTKIAIAIFAGRASKYVVFAWLASHAPKLLLKIPLLKDELSKLEQSA